MATRAAHDARPSIAHDRTTDDNFDAFIFVPGTYYEVGKPERLRVLGGAKTLACFEIIGERTTSESRNAESLVEAQTVPIVLALTTEEAEWLHATLGRALEWKRKQAGAAAPVAREAWGYATREDPDGWEHAASREEAIEGAIEKSDSEDSAEAWIVHGSYQDVASLIPDAERIIDWMTDHAIENGCPDGIDEPLDLADGANGALDVALQAWAAKYVTPSFWLADGKPERVPLPAVPASDRATDPGETARPE